MINKESASRESIWVGKAPTGHEIADSAAAFNGGNLWVGLHSADQDTLVFDPVESDALAERISFYSLTQHRKRTFPRSVVMKQIRELTDDISLHRAKHTYENRAALQQEHTDAAAVVEAGRVEHQRLGVIAAHRRYMDGLGAEYLGVAPTPASHRPGRRTKCRICGIGLDDFASTVCVACNGVLCSCGACACSAESGRRETP